MVAGRTTEERIAATLEAIQKSGERITLTEFAQRAQVGYSTLCHEYKEWADRVRKHRDGAAKRRGNSRDSQTAPREVLDLVAQLRKEQRALREEHDELREKIPALHAEVTTLRQANARLRGVQIRIHETLVALLGEHRAEQILSRALVGLPPDHDAEREPF